MKDILKIGDIVLAGAVGLSILLSFFIFRFVQEEGQTVSVFVDGRQTHHLSLKDVRQIHVRGPAGVTTIHVENGYAWIDEAPCPQKICMRMGKISRTGEMVVCVPNRILLKIDGKDARNLDGITM